MEARTVKPRRVYLAVAAVIAFAVIGLMSCSERGGVLTQIVITPDTPSVASGYSLQLYAQGVLTDGLTYYMTYLTWSSSDTGIAQVDSNGIVTAGTGTGIVTITATESDSGRNVTGSIELEVASIQAITVTPANPGMAISTEYQFAATATLSNGATQDLTSCSTSSLTWTASSSDIASVASTPGESGSGLVTSGTVTGETYITATDLISNITGSTLLTVTDTALTSIAVAISDASVTSLTTGTTQQLTATATYSDATTLDRTTSMTWTSSDEALATVSDSGLVSALTAGTVTITATDPVTAVAGTLELTIN